MKTFKTHATFFIRFKQGDKVCTYGRYDVESDAVDGLRWAPAGAWVEPGSFVIDTSPVAQGC